MTSTLVECFKHNRWANLRLLDACADLTGAQLDATVAGTFGTIRETLIHIVGSEEYYHALVLTGAAPSRSDEDDAPNPSIAELRERARQCGDGLVEAADRTDPAQMLRRRHGEVPAAVVLLQAINHATEHRSQIATILTQQGIEPPSFSGWAYGEEMANA